MSFIMPLCKSHAMTLYLIETSSEENRHTEANFYRCVGNLATPF